MGSHKNVIWSKSNPSDVGQREFNPIAPHNDNKMEDMMGNKEGFIGVLDVFIHQARDIHNICIYHKQDVYAKIFLTNDPASTTESTQTINGGGQNPVFNENLRINIRNGDSSLRCEIWMLSRVRNYLQDQLLGFTLVPLCEILVKNGKLEKEFELSTSEICHSPSGFVKLSFIYTGSPPELLEIPTFHCLSNQESNECDHDSCELEKIEFPDPKIMHENEMMVSACADIESQNVVNSQSQTTSETDYSVSSDSNDHLILRFSKEITSNSETSEKKEEKSQSQSQSSVDSIINIEPEQKVVQQEIVDMYLKSMKQFTEALAKMNFPMEEGNESVDSGVNDCTESKSKSKEEGEGPKVFYGSRAFF